jgi:hypothetical protein
LIKHRASGELRDAVRSRLYDGADDVKDDTDDDEFDSAEDVCDFGGGGLKSGQYCNRAAEHDGHT